MAQNNLDAVLSKLKEISSLETIDVFLLSKNSKVKFKAITAKQQKDLIEAAASGPKAAFLYPKIVNEIILENSSEKNVLVSDRALVLMGMKISSFGPIHKMEKEGKTYEIDLEKIVNEFDPTKVKLKTNDSFTQGSITINCSIPNLEYENNIIEGFLKSHGNDFETDSKLQKIISDVYILEIIKYIESIVVNEAEKTVIDLKQLNINQKIKAVESITAGLIQKAIDFVSKSKEAETKLTSQKIGDEVLDINLDTSFFSAS